MKKLAIIIILMLGFVNILIHAQNTIQIDTSKGKIDLVLPEDPIELKDAYINMAKLYLEERFDHEKSLKEIEDLLIISDKYKELLLKYGSIVDELQKIPFYSQGFVIGTGIDWNIPNYTIKGNIGYRGVLFEMFSFELILQLPPLGINILFGFNL